MQCEKCGYINKQYDIICQKCGSPLNIEKNIELQKKYNHKPKAIDIEEIVPDNSEAVFDSTQKKIRNVLIVLLFCPCAITKSSFIYSHFIHSGKKPQRIIFPV